MMPLRTYEELVEDRGQDVADLVVGYGWHNHDDAGRPCWTAESLERALGIIQIDAMPKTDGTEEARDQ